MDSFGQSSRSTGLPRGWLLIFMILIPLSLQSFGEDGAIAGRVTDESSNGISNVEVDVFVPGQTNSIKTVHTDADGYYTVSDLAPGSYQVLFTGDPDSGPTGYIWEFYSDKQTLSDADLVTVASGATTPDINATIAPIPTDPYEPNDDFATAYTVTSGTYDNIVADTQTGESDVFKIYLEEGQDLRVATLNTIPVYPDPQYGLDIDIFIYDSAGNKLMEAVSDRAIETLYLSNVTAGWYYISVAFAPPCVLSLSITAGDFEIGEITGRVTNSLGEGVQNVKAGFYTWNDLVWSLFYANAMTDASGNYKFAFTPGLYRLAFDVSEALDPYVLKEWYNDQTTSATSAFVSITAGQTTSGIDAQLADGAAISGQVTNMSATPVNLAIARAYNALGGNEYATTDASGNYTIGHIPVGDGTRKVRFSKSSYATEWWNDQSSFGAADSVSVQTRQTTSGINAQLTSQGRFTGRVTDGLSNGIPNVVVRAYDTIQNLVQVGSATTNWDGYYTVSSLPTMNARVQFDAGRNSSFNSEFYTDKVNFAEADAVLVTAGSILYNLDAQLSAKSITIREPDGGEKWCGGSSHFLQWDNTGSIANVKIEYSMDNGRSFTTEIASTPNTETYTWTVPAVSSSLCVIRISDASNPADYDDSNTNITVTANKCQTPSDFNKDGLSDATVWRPSTGFWYTLFGNGDYSSTPWGLASDIAVAGDYDGDSATDVAVWRPTSGTWYILSSNLPGTYGATQWGLESDVAVPGDYDGDGKTDIAVYRPGNGTWYILPSASPGTYTGTGWGLDSDIPVPADYDGDGKTDIAVWRPGTGFWYILPSASPGTYTGTGWGVTTDIPVPGDYDGDSKTDLAVWRPSTGTWYLMPTASLQGIYSSTVWGMDGDKPVTGDYDGDGKTDIVVYRPETGAWYALLSTDPGTYVSALWGLSEDQAISSATPTLSQFP